MFEFITWFLWLGLFAVLKQRICRAYPGIRSAFRGVFLVTAAVAIAPALWILVRAPLGAPHLVRNLNHYFGIGIYAQTAIQALLQVRWLAVVSPGLRSPSPNGGLCAGSEHQLLATMASLSQIIRK